MRKKLLFGMIMVLTLVVLFLCAPTVHAGSYTVGEKTNTFEKFSLEGIDEQIMYVCDYVNNSDGILFGTETGKIYHINLDGTIEEIAEEEATNLYNEGKLLVDYEGYCAYSDEEPEEFSQNLPELTFVEGTGDNAGSYAVKIGENIVSDYVYLSDDFDIINEGIGNVIVGIAKNKISNELDVWINTKISSKLVTINDSDNIVPSDDSAFLTVYTFNDEGIPQLIVFDWSGNEIISLELPDVSHAEVCKINTNNQEFIEVYIYYSDGAKTEIYDLDGNKVLETENGEWLYAFQFGMVEYHSDDANTSRIVDIKNNITISDAVETNYLDLYATTAKLKKTSEDYLAPGKYYFVTFENEVYEMTISYTILGGANSSIDKTSSENLTVKVDGDLEKLEGIYVDNEKIDDNNFTLAEGSTIVTLKNEYLKALEVGEHTLKVKYLDGDVETKFIITEEITEDDTQTPGETPNEGNQETEDEGKETTGSDDKADDTTAPGNLPNTGKFAVISILIVTFVVGVISFIKTRKYKGI